MQIILKQRFCKDVQCLGIFIIYKLMCDCSYFLLSSSAYQQEFCMDFLFIKYIIGMIWLLLAFAVTMGREGTLIFFLRMIQFFTFIPMSSVLAMRNESALYYSIVMATFIFVELLVLNVNFIPNRSKHYFDHYKLETTGYFIPLFSAKAVSIICILLSLLLLVLMYMRNGVPRLTALNIYNVYEVRQAVSLGKIESYLMAVVTCVVVPLGIAEGIVHKKALRTSFYTLTQILMFLWTGNKIYAFSIFLIYFVALIYRKKVNTNFFFFSFACLGVTGCFSGFIQSGILETVFSVYNRRMVMDSAALKYFYFDYFIIDKNQITGLAGTIFAPLLSTPLTTEYRLSLYQQYTGFISNANTGIYGGDIAALGAFGFAVVPILLIVLLKYISSVQKDCGELFAVILFSYIIYRLNETCIFLFFFDFTGVALFLFMVFYKVRSVSA